MKLKMIEVSIINIVIESLKVEQGRGREIRAVIITCESCHSKNKSPLEASTRLVTVLSYIAVTSPCLFSVRSALVTLTDNLNLQIVAHPS